MKCIMCNEEIEDGNMSSAVSLGSFPPATIKEVPIHKVCPHYNGWKFYGGLTPLAPDKGQAEVVKDESGSAPCG